MAGRELSRAAWENLLGNGEGGNQSQPSRSPLLESPSYPVILSQSPDADALRKKPKNEWRDFGLKDPPNRDTRRRIFLLDQLQDVACDQVRFWCGVHVLFQSCPRFCDFILIKCGIGFHDRVIEVGVY